MTDAELPLIALVGRPNVGKSSLYNRLVGGRPALVEDMPGVTRDRRYGLADWGPKRFRVVDTGGLDPSAAGVLGAMRQQTLRALDEADLVVFVVDAREGVTAVDDDVARVLRQSGRPVLVAANKVDTGKNEASAADAFALGFPDVFPISASHGRGVNDLLDAAVTRLPARARVPGGRVTDGVARPKKGATLARSNSRKSSEAVEPGEAVEPDATADAPAGPLRLAFIGKPNVGKSSLVNCLLGEERVLVHDEPGTTRDPIDTQFSFGGREYVLVDTAGMRRRRSIDTLTEHVAGKMARDQLERCDVAALVIDARQGATAEDARLAGLIEESGRCALIVLNKKDLVGRAAIDGKVEASREELSFLRYAPLLVTSAVTRAGVTGILDAATRVREQAARRISTGELNKLLEQIVAHKPPPAGRGGRHVRLYYITQAAVRPPTFFLSTNHPAEVGYPYRRFLINQLRETYGFEGTPIRVAVRAHKQKNRQSAAAAAAKRSTPAAQSRRR
ncbi:MAG TPA: ribosome biogenesis GTPase Der [Polyangia bacterium]|nr:ribosome biogenesis GTPase Der [Polyangia bacterium]